MAQRPGNALMAAWQQVEATRAENELLQDRLMVLQGISSPPVQVMPCCADCCVIVLELLVAVRDALLWVVEC
jgi:hypothetical protein